jgi:hypothetical protein
MSSPIRLAAVLLVGLLLAPADAAEKLSMKFREGEKYGYLIAQHITTAGEVQGKNFESLMEQKLNISTAIKSVNADGSAKAEQTIDRVQMKMVMPNPTGEGTMTIDVDSASEAEPENAALKAVAANISRMVGQAISMTINPSGEMTDIQIPEKILQTQQGAAAAGGGNQLEQMFKQSGLRLPAEEISKGHQWSQPMEVKLPYGTMQITTNYTYQGKNSEGLHEIAAEMDIALQPAENAPLKVTATAKEANGTFLFDNQAGRLTRSQIQQVLDIDIAGTAKQTITTQVDMKLTDGTQSSDEADPGDN